MRDRDEKIVKEEKMAKMEVDGDTRTSVNEERKVRYCGKQYLYHSTIINYVTFFLIVKSFLDCANSFNDS